MSNILVQNIKHTNNTTAQTIDTSGRTTVSIMNNDSTFRSDGGAVTQNLVQGLCKAWVKGDEHTSENAFNLASTTDNGTGDYTFTWTNSFVNNNNSVTLGANSKQTLIQSMGSDNVRRICENDSGTAVNTGIVNTSVHGDLA